MKKKRYCCRFKLKFKRGIYEERITKASRKT